MPRDTASKHWVFTLNNYQPADEQRLADNSDSFEYFVFGRETGESGTPHLQGYVVFKTRLRLAQVRLLISDRAHLEKRRGTAAQAANYCKKDGDFVEHGTLPVGGGTSGSFEQLRDFLRAFDGWPSDEELLMEFPGLYGRYRQSVQHFRELLCQTPTIVQGELRPWQVHVDGLINEEADSRKVLFIVDPVGNKGKTWLTQYWFSTRDDMQKLSVGKRDDIAHAIDPSKRVFVFDIPRTQMEYLQYPILEQLKDQMVFSPKYESQTKILHSKCHVVVFCNEQPDFNKMTNDRYSVIMAWDGDGTGPLDNI